MVKEEVDKLTWGTVTLQLNVLLPAFALIVALPVAIAVTLPFDTLATAGLLEVHFTFLALYLIFKVFFEPITIVVFFNDKTGVKTFTRHL